MTETVEIPIAFVQPSGRRAINPDTVDRLAKSIGEVGLLNPITVRKGEVTGRGAPKAGFEIIAGDHRFEACRSLGMETVVARVFDLDALAAELAAIDENLCRSELSAAEQLRQIQKRERVWKSLHGWSARSSNSKPADRDSGQSAPTSDGPAPSGTRPEASPHPGRPRGFAADTAAATGETKRSVNRKRRQTKVLGDDLDKTVGTSLDSSTQLEALTHVPEDVRHALIERAAAGESVHVDTLSTKPEPNERLVLRAVDALTACARNMTPATFQKLVGATVVSDGVCELAEIIVSAHRNDATDTSPAHPQLRLVAETTGLAAPR